ncbi:MAG TPA: PEGA domain-containing protein [Polyangiaceae bacterium]
MVHAAEPPAPAGDASISESRRADAKARYEQGAAAYAAGRFKDAVDLFLEADALAPSAPLSFNIARAYEKLGDDSGALRWYRDYLRRAPDAANAKDVQAAVDGLENRLAKKGVQQLTVLSTPAGATVTVDGRPVGVTPWTGDLFPGKHSVGLSLRGYDDQTLEVELAGHRSRDLTATLVKSAAPLVASPAAPGAAQAAPVTPPPSAPARETASGGFGIWPWVTLGAGGAALGGALVFELLRRSSESDAEADDTQIGYQEKLDQMESRQTTARILAGVGGALVVTGGVLLAIDLGSSSKQGAAGLSVAPTPGGAFATASGRF